MHERTTRRLLELMPKRSLSDLVGWTSDRRVPKPILHRFIRSFAEHYGINLEQCSKPVEDYNTFDEFFTRRLRDGLRPIDAAADSLVSPSDGSWQAAGDIDGLQLTQIKGKHYSASELLASESDARPFTDGSFATIYLSPKDYHRVHFPYGGKVERLRYIPGSLFPVNPPSVRSIDKLFAVNERLVVFLETEHGPVVVIMVGATCVSRISASFDPSSASFLHGQAAEKSYKKAIAVDKGEELGIFHMGSTVVMLFAKDAVDFGKQRLGETVIVGKAIGKWRTS